jgi:hypothetical protein
VVEVAEDIGYDDIAFLDDNASDATGRTRVIGKIDGFEKFTKQFKYAFVGIENNKLRSELIKNYKTVAIRFLS